MGPSPASVVLVDERILDQAGGNVKRGVLRGRHLEPGHACRVLQLGLDASRGGDNLRCTH
jgi:hypothetical protein